MNYKDSENLKTVLASMNILKYTVIESQKKVMVNKAKQREEIRRNASL